MIDEKLKTGLTQSEKESIIKMMEDKARIEKEMYSVEGHIAHAKRKGIKQGIKQGKEEEKTKMIVKMSKRLSSQEIANLLEMELMK